MENPEKIYFPNLDALRSIACLFVLVSHIIWEVLVRHFPDSAFIDNPLVFFFLGNGGFGVRIFFTLSGFLISYLLIRETQKTGRIYLKNFYIRRILRIWPVYFTVIIFVFVVYGLGKKIIGLDSPIYESPIYSSFFLSNYDLIRILQTPGQYANGMLSLTWSVSVEEQFYLFWPTIFLLVPIRYFFIPLMTVLFIAVTFSMFHAKTPNIIYHHTISNFIFLGSGGMLAYFLLTYPRFLTLFREISRTIWIMVLSVGLLFLSYFRIPLFNIHYGIVLYLIISAFVLCLFILTQVSDINRPFEIKNIPWLVSMGKYTYGLYMYHRIAMLFVGLVFQVFFEKKTLWVDAVYVIVVFIVTFLLSIVSYRFMEGPLQNLKDNFSIFRK